jgi:hypothetical protein
VNSKLPDIAQIAMRVLAGVEQSVKRFSRMDKYGLGVRLQQLAHQAALYLRLGWNEPEVRYQHVLCASRAIDALVIQLQLAKAVGAFRSRRQFEALARLVDDLGRRCGGWLKKLRLSGQNGQDKPPRPACPDSEFPLHPIGVSP